MGLRDILADSAGRHISEPMGHLYSEPPLASLGAAGAGQPGPQKEFSSWSPWAHLSPPHPGAGALPLGLEEMPRERVSWHSFPWLAAVLEAPLGGRPHWVWAKILSSKEELFLGAPFIKDLVPEKLSQPSLSLSASTHLVFGMEK